MIPAATRRSWIDPDCAACRSQNRGWPCGSHFRAGLALLKGGPAARLADKGLTGASWAGGPSSVRKGDGGPNVVVDGALTIPPPAVNALCLGCVAVRVCSRPYPTCPPDPPAVDWDRL